MRKKLRIGFHVSIEGGIANSVTNALEVGCSAFQIFTRSPRRWAAKPLDESDVALFKSRLSESGIARECVAVHMPYLPNLASPNPEAYNGSIKILNEELGRCSILGIPNLVVHLGNHGGDGSPAGIQRVSEGIADAQEQIKTDAAGIKVVALLENSAGQKNSIGSRFEELRLLLDKIDRRDVGVCIDTCHLFAEGYDLRTNYGVDQMIESFSDVIGFKVLKWIHLNDSKDVLGSHRDRHEHIGRGNIGSLGMKAFLTSKMAGTAPLVLETPKKTLNDDKNNMMKVQEILDESGFE